MQSDLGMDVLELSGVDGSNDRANGTRSVDSRGLEPTYPLRMDSPYQELPGYDQPDDDYDSPLINDTFVAGGFPLLEDVHTDVSIECASTSSYVNSTTILWSGRGTKSHQSHNAASIPSQCHMRQRDDWADAFFQQSDSDSTVIITTATTLSRNAQSPMSHFKAVPIARPVHTASISEQPARTMQCTHSWSTDADISLQSTQLQTLAAARSQQYFLCSSPSRPSSTLLRADSGKCSDVFDKHTKKIAYLSADRKRRAKIKKSMDQLRRFITLQKTPES